MIAFEILCWAGVVMLALSVLGALFALGLKLYMYFAIIRTGRKLSKRR